MQNGKTEKVNSFGYLRIIVQTSMAPVRLVRRLPQILALGDVAVAVRRMDAADVESFADLTGDRNPLHFDDAFAAQSRFGARVVHGMLYATLFNAIIAADMPGAVHVTQAFEFKQPVFLGDEVTARLQVRAITVPKRLVEFDEVCTNQEGTVVLCGSASLFAPRRYLRPVRPSK